MSAPARTRSRWDSSALSLGIPGGDRRGVVLIRDLQNHGKAGDCSFESASLSFGAPSIPERTGYPLQVSCGVDRRARVLAGCPPSQDAVARRGGVSTRKVVKSRKDTPTLFLGACLTGDSTASPVTWAFTGGGDGIRTHGLYIANVALCQLSYTPWQPPTIVGAGWAGIPQPAVCNADGCQRPAAARAGSGSSSSQ